MKGFVAAVLAGIPGALASIVLWTVVVVVLQVLFWVVFVVQGFLCSKGKFGLGWFDPPSQETLDATMHWYMMLTVFAFTFGEVLAGLVGAFFGGALGVAAQRVFGRSRRQPS